MAASVDVPISEALNALLKRLQDYENARVRIGIIGESGSGKSSLINAISGEYISEVGVTETTTEPLPYDVPNSNVTYIDLPGCGTKAWPAATYVDALKLLTDYDVFVFVNRGRILEHDIMLYKELRDAGMPVFIARSFFDAAVNGELGRPAELRRSDEELKTEIVRDFRTQFQDQRARVFVTATAPGGRIYELPDLQEAISNAMSEISEGKGIRFLEGAAAYTHELLDKKTAAARKLVHMHAATAAASAAIPIPGVGIAADLTTVIAMNQAIARTFKIDVESDDPRLNSPILAPAFNALRGYLSREAVIVTLRTYAGRSFAKEGAKYIPFLGTAIAAGIAAAMIELLGSHAIRDFRAAAEAILESAS